MSERQECPMCGHAGREDSDLETNVKKLMAAARDSGENQTATWFFPPLDMGLQVTAVPRKMEAER